ncbi:hypothetical protein AK812_SmicGene49079 [Symbiodinium microadriaticum]|uniref:Uncharacterized protein n=1 Tax=Symbiodinium microadriaticum TaxID=2951 RepID=A0A1Q9DP20_SYMMI|nr:hypothetical protein AK812_SmicGene49079 [Symbiodinium microadriaticum]CAE7543450.1 unnamed protein product [Symbiodinium microadriaticum]
MPIKRTRSTSRHLVARIKDGTMAVNVVKNLLGEDLRPRHSSIVPPSNHGRCLRQAHVLAPFGSNMDSKNIKVSIHCVAWRTTSRHADACEEGEGEGQAEDQ